MNQLFAFIPARRICPIFQVSNVTGENLDLLRQFLNLLTTRVYYDENDSAEFQIDDTYTVPGAAEGTLNALPCSARPGVAFGWRCSALRSCPLLYFTLRRVDAPCRALLCFKLPCVACLGLVLQNLALPGVASHDFMDLNTLCAYFHAPGFVLRFFASLCYACCALPVFALRCATLLCVVRFALLGAVLARASLFVSLPGLAARRLAWPCVAAFCLATPCSVLNT